MAVTGIGTYALNVIMGKISINISIIAQRYHY